MTKKDQIKFPPPIIKPDRKPLPPPPAKLIRKTPPKQDVVKFPPPIVKPDQPKTKNKTVEGDPIKKTEMKEVVILGDPTKSSTKVNDEINEALKKEVDQIKKKSNKNP